MVGMPGGAGVGFMVFGIRPKEGGGCGVRGSGDTVLQVLNGRRNTVVQVYQDDV